MVSPRTVERYTPGRRGRKGAHRAGIEGWLLPAAADPYTHPRGRPTLVRWVAVDRPRE